MKKRWRSCCETAGRRQSEERADLLRKALGQDEVGVAKGLIDIGADPNGTYFETNTTPLMMSRSAAAVRVLLDAGANPNARNDTGITPLTRAAYLAPEVTEVLLKAGARVDEPADQIRGTPLGSPPATAMSGLSPPARCRSGSGRPRPRQHVSAGMRDGNQGFGTPAQTASPRQQAPVREGF